MPKRKRICQFLSFLMLFCLCAVQQPLPAKAAEGDTMALIDVSQGQVRIYPDGYTIGSQNKIPYTGSYILTGSGSDEVYFEGAAEGEVTYDVILKDLTIDSGLYQSALDVGTAVTLNLTAEGVNSVTGYNHPGIQANGDSGAVNISLSPASSLELSSHEGPIRSIAEAISAQIINDSDDVVGGDTLEDRTQPLRLSRGTASAHTWTWESLDDTAHQISCDVCGGSRGVFAHVMTDFSYTAEGHTQSCAYCDYMSDEITPHTMSEWESRDRQYHERYCVGNCGYTEQEEHQWDEGTLLPDVPEEGMETYRYTCQVCGEVKDEAQAAITIEMEEDFGDSWNGAGIQVYRDGELWQTIGINEEDVHSQTIWLTYDSDIFYEFAWQKGEYDEECAFTVYLPGQSEPVFTQTDLSYVRTGEFLFSINGADYSGLNEVIERVPSDLQNYTKESVQRLLEQIRATNWRLPKNGQPEVDAQTAAIEEALAGLVPQEAQPGALNVADGDIYITETGYRRSADGEEIPYTGDYWLTGTTEDYNVIVESGDHVLELCAVSITSYEEEEDESGWYWNDVPPMDIWSGASVSLRLEADNEFIYHGYSVAGLRVSEGASLHILESAGSLTVQGGYDAAGIGGDIGETAGTILIDGGDITALSTSDGAGIGGGYEGGAGTIIVNGGTVTGLCLQEDGAGIGCGDDGVGGTVEINGGIVTGRCMEDDGSGIGGADDGAIDSVVINGGTITASSIDGAAIGGGDDSAGGRITINDGLIIIDSSHLGYHIIGNGDNDESGESDTNYVQINGGNIISDAPDSIVPAPRNAAGQLLKPVELTVGEELADELVLITLPDDSRMLVTAYGTRIIVYVPEEVNEEELVIASGYADYSAVNAALEKIPADLSLYTAESVAKLQAARDAVVEGLDYTHQEEVDQMARDIEQAISELELLDETEPTDPPTEDKTDGTGNTADDGSRAVDTGDHGQDIYMILLILGMSGAVILAFGNALKKKNR